MSIKFKNLSVDIVQNIIMSPWFDQIYLRHWPEFTAPPKFRFPLRFSFRTSGENLRTKYIKGDVCLSPYGSSQACVNTVVIDITLFSVTQCCGVQHSNRKRGYWKVFVVTEDTSSECNDNNFRISKLQFNSPSIFCRQSLGQTKYKLTF